MSRSSRFANAPRALKDPPCWSCSSLSTSGPGGSPKSARSTVIAGVRRRQGRMSGSTVWIPWRVTTVPTSAGVGRRCADGARPVVCGVVMRSAKQPSASGGNLPAPSTGYREAMPDLPDHGVMSPSPRLWRMRRAEVATAGGVGAVVAGTAAGLTLGLAAAAIAVAVAIAAALAALWFVRNRFRSWVYQEREEDLIVERGVMIHRLSVVPYGRMQ